MLNSIEIKGDSDHLLTEYLQILKEKEDGVISTISFEPQDLNELHSVLMTSPTKDINMKLSNLVLSREIFIEIFKTIQEGVQIVDHEGNIRYVNPAFLRILGVKEEDRIGKNIKDVSPDGSLMEVLKTKKSVNNLKNHPKGTRVELVSSATPILLHNNLIGAIAFVQDIKEVICLTEKLIKSEKMVENLSEKIGYFSKSKYTFDDVIGSSVSMENIVEMAKNAAANDVVVLIQGETGTGKEVIANAIHKASTRSQKPFISINCSAISQNLMESEFFGHEKGSFTGAYKNQLGKFELANGGTLFLDEIGDMDLSLQVKMLRAIQEREIRRVGGEVNIPLDVRIIAATNRNLKKMMVEGTFREDLYYRLNVWNIVIPPLRERRVDIEVLADYLSKKICRRLGKRIVTIDQSAYSVLFNYNWPGNVRELENVLERVILNTDNNIINSENLSFLCADDCDSTLSNDAIIPLEEVEKIMIQKAIERYGESYKSKVEVAQALGISLATLYNKLKKYKFDF